MPGKMRFFKDFEELKNNLVVALRGIGLNDIACTATDEDLESICISYLSVENVLLTAPEGMHVELLKGMILSMLAYARVNHGLGGESLFIR